MKTRDKFGDCYAAWNQGPIGCLFPHKLSQICLPVLAPKMLLYKHRGSSRPWELCKYGYNHQAMGESGPHNSHLNPYPRTNKRTLEQFKFKLEKIMGCRNLQKKLNK